MEFFSCSFSVLIKYASVCSNSLICGSMSSILSSVFNSDVVLETAVLVSRPLETVFWRSWSWSWSSHYFQSDNIKRLLVLTLPVLVLVLDLVSKDWSRVFFETSHVAKMPTGASTRTAAEHILSAHLTATS